MNVECAKYLPYSEAWHGELTKISQAISILYRLRATNELQIDCTKAAQKALEESHFVPIVSQREMFLASSARADETVMQELRAILDEYRTEFTLVSWTDLVAGDIRENIWNKISSCTYGACYFSEPDTEVIAAKPADGRARRAPKKTDPSYRDNSNVLFEAGILYALRQLKRDPMRKLLLIRESDAPRIPFDLNSEYMVRIERQNGILNVEKFRTELRKTMDQIVER